MSLRWTITYTVFDDSYDMLEYGWVAPDGMEYALSDRYGYHSELLREAEDGKFDRSGTLCGVLKDADKFDCLEISKDKKYLQCPDRDFISNPVQFDLHVYGVTEASKQRIFRLVENI